jgi:crotonobetainyl-CoA:carnitine CoA-transferase CaiB-like acyl-CoA transferase
MATGEKPRVYSRHLTGKETTERLSNFNVLLSQMMSSAEGKLEALSDVKVVEISQANFAGIITATMLAEFGAEVIKVEPPEGDPARKITPYGANVNGVGIPFLMESRNKHYITLDLSCEEGCENFRKLASKADIVIDALKPGLMDSLGIGYRQLSQLNPGLVYLAISPYGHYTSKAKEFSNIPDTDLTAQAESGYPSLSGDPRAPEPYNYPVKAGIWAAWYMGAALAVAGTLTALFHRHKTGEGQMVDIATNDAISAWQAFSVVWGFTNERPRDRIAGFDWCIYPYGFFKCKDGYVTVTASADTDFRGLLRVLHRWDLENDWRFAFDRIVDDIDKAEELRTELEKTMAKYTRDELTNKALSFSAKAARNRLRGMGFPIIVPTREPREVLEEKHWKIRNTFVEIDDPIYGKFIIPTSVPKMSETPPRIKWIKCGVGEDNEQIYKKYGLKKGIN